jgi:hypothetical protein
MSADGKWNVTINTPMGARSVTLDVATAGETFTGKASGNGLPDTEFTGKVAGDTLTWTQKMTQPMPMDLEFSVKVAGDDMNGSVKLGAFGNAPVTGKRA